MVVAKGQHFKRLNNEVWTGEPLISAPLIIRWCGAMQQSSRGALADIQTQRLEQFKSSLSLRAPTYSLLSWLDIFVLLWPDHNHWFLATQWCVRKGNHLSCEKCLAPLVLFHAIYIRSQLFTQARELFIYVLILWGTIVFISHCCNISYDIQMLWFTIPFPTK